MLTAKNRDAHQAIDYYTQTCDNISLTTRWYGRGAEILGLSGTVKSKEVFANVCRGFTPDGRGRLGRNTKRAAIDFTFSAPKSVSLSALVGADEGLVFAHHKAVEKTLSFIEKRYAQTRVRLGKVRPIVKTGNLIVAQFDHIESRELDPHLHTHALVMNLTQTENGRWYSLHNSEIYKNKKKLGRLYQRYLAAEVQKLGYATERLPHGQFEIKGYKQQDLSGFCKRRQQIISEVGAGASWETRENAWSITRKAKLHLPTEELKELWNKQAQVLGIVVVIPKTTQSNVQTQDTYSTSNTGYKQKDDLENKTYIERLLQLNNKDLLLVDRYITEYFQSDESKIYSLNTRDKQALLQALQFPQVSERIAAIQAEFNRICEQEIVQEKLQLRKGIGF